MRHSVYFFALNSVSVADQFAEPATLLERMEERIRKANQFSDTEIADSIRLARQICEGRRPSDCEPGYFNALCWLLEMASEKVDIPGFVLFRGLSYLDSIGIWPWFQAESPPFPVPVCSAPPPEVGFLTCSRIASTVLPGIEQLPECSDQEEDAARTHFQEVVETILEDGLDLLAVML